MGSTRLEAFSDGVLAIIITIMVLELKVPHGGELSALLPVLPGIFNYALSFVYIGIYWNNHHHLFHATDRTSGAILWANLFLLFWLSLIPFVTAWMSDNHFAMAPTALYGFVLLMCALAYSTLQWTIIADQGQGSLLAQAYGRDIKGKLSLLAYAIAIPVAFYEDRISLALYVVVALMWMIPDRRIVRALSTRHDEETRKRRSV